MLSSFSGTLWLTALSSPPKAAKIPLSSELGIDEFHFNDFSLDNDAMITASLRMFLELGVVQKFKIDYEVRPWNVPCNMFIHPYINMIIPSVYLSVGFVPLASDCEEELSNCGIP